MAAGRPTKLSPEMQKLICQGIRIGLSYKDSAVNAGITEKTFYNWVERGEKAKSGKYYLFLQELQEAKQKGQAILVNELTKLARGGMEVVEEDVVVMPDGKEVPVKRKKKTTLPDKQAIQFILERRYPEEWGRQDRLELSGSVDTSPTFETNLDDDDLDPPGDDDVLEAPED
jgi:transposase